MTQMMPDDLWREFPKTATEFEARFATEEDCRAYSNSLAAGADHSRNFEAECWEGGSATAVAAHKQHGHAFRDHSRPDGACCAQYDLPAATYQETAKQA
jgi:hypothetical protein